MEDARQTLLDVSDTANKMSQKLVPQMPAAPASAALRRQRTNRQ
jgi:hypothetical protein